MVCEFNWCQAPALRGVTGGRSRPSTLVTGFEKVSVILVLGVIFVPGAGVATAVALVPAGNQEIVLTVGISQLRAATATAPVPARARALRVRLVEAAGRRLVTTWVPGRPKPASATGVSKLTVTGCPRLRVRKAELSLATGVVSVTRTCSSLPVSQEIQPGRLTVAW